MDRGYGKFRYKTFRIPHMGNIYLDDLKEYLNIFEEFNMKIKILITDPLSDQGLELLRNENFDVVYKPNPSLDELSILVSDIDGWIIRSGTKVTKELLENANNLQIIGRAGVGTDNINIDFATSRGVVVMNVPDGNTISAAEHTMALLMSLSRNIYLGHAGLMKGQWNRNFGWE